MKAIRNSLANINPYSIELYLRNVHHHPMKLKTNNFQEDSIINPAQKPDLKQINKLTEKNYQLIVENLNAGVLFQDEKGELISVNKKIADLFNVPVERLQQITNIQNRWNTHWEIKNEDGISICFEKSPFMKALQTGIQQTEILVIKLKNGENRWLHFSSQPIFNDNCIEPFAVVSSIVDITNEKKLSLQLKHTNDRLLLLNRTTTDAIWEWDMQTGHIFRNDALMDMIGYQAEDKKGLSWWLRRIHPEDRNRLSDKVKDTTDNNLQSWEDEYRFKCADGQYKYMHDKGFVVYENGLPIKMIGSLQNVSEIKELETQIMKEKLQKQKEISETVIQVQEKERTRIGHELHDNVNQLLFTTKLFVDKLTPAKKEEKEIKKKSIEYILMAIEEIRKLSKELVVPQLTQKGLIDNIYNLLQDIHLSTGIKIKFTHDNDIELLSPGKRITLFRIVQEQLKNILKHSKAKLVEIYLQCKDMQVQLTIKDDGIGFDSKKVSQGIGLSNIQERTIFYNGTVEMKTKPGDGCLLIVSIPVV